MFRRYAAFFRPEESDTLTAGFEATWQELIHFGVDLSSEEKLDSLKKKLAQRILVSATAWGARGIGTIKEQRCEASPGVSDVPIAVTLWRPSIKRLFCLGCAPKAVKLASSNFKVTCINIEPSPLVSEKSCTPCQPLATQAHQGAIVERRRCVDGGFRGQAFRLRRELRRNQALPFFKRCSMTMRFVEVKTEEQQSVLMPHRTHSQMTPSTKEQLPLAAFVAALFFFSGFAALVYQVVWMRHLSLFFGSDVYAAAITLSVFMGGLSAGTALAEKFADRLARPLLAYGCIEFLIGLYALFFIALLHAFTPFLREIYLGYFDRAPLVYQTTRIGLAALALLVPTMLMGMTLPLVVSGFVRRNSELGLFSGTFYAVNTLGALVGTLVAAFALIPWQGITRTTLIAVGINLTIGLGIAVLGIRMRFQKHFLPADADATTGSAWHYQPTSARWALFAIGLSGLAALALEVVWTRILTLSFSGTVYSFAIMLSSFLFGIFCGSRKAARMIDAHPNPIHFFGFLELGIGCLVVLLGLLSYVAPTIFSLLVWGLTRIGGNNFAFGSVVGQFVVAGLLILPPTILLGATFPAAVRICTPGVKKAGSGTARVYAANTAGAVLGSLLAGFVMIPTFGSRNSLVMLAAIFTANGLVLLWRAEPQALRHNARAALCVAFSLMMGVAVIMLPRQTVANYGLQKKTDPEIIYHGEGVAHSIDVVRTENGNVIMMVDGNTEADTSFIQRRHFILKGHLPLLLSTAPRDVAVIGLGLGITLAATARNPEVDHIQVIELTPEMVLAHAQLEGITDGVLHDPKINVRIDDGRNFLAMTDHKFDMITADPIHPRISGVGYLYTEEYYQAIRQRLRPGGVVCQWMPMYSISRDSFDVAFRTFASVFDNASFWYVRGHGLFVATVGTFTIDYAQLKNRIAAGPVARDLDAIEIHGAPELLAHLLMGPTQIKKYLTSTNEKTLNVDDNAKLEYATPFEFLQPTKEIVAALMPYAGFDPALLVNISDKERAEVDHAWSSRQARLLSELDEPLH